MIEKLEEECDILTKTILCTKGLVRAIDKADNCIQQINSFILRKSQLESLALKISMASITIIRA